MILKLVVLLLYIITYSSTVTQANELEEIFLTDCKPAELEYHLTMFTISRRKCPKNVTIYLESEDESIAIPLTKEILFLPSDDDIPKVIFAYGKSVGSTNIKVNFTASDHFIDKRHSSIHVTIVHSVTLQSVNVVIGWIYFLAWSISFYPQTIENFKRKSVLGLNFDYLCYNLTGFLFYSLYNICLFYIPEIRDEYFDRYGGSVIPVQPNDVFFALHAAFLTFITLMQCVIFERGTQKVSVFCKVFVVCAWLFVGVSLIPTLLHKLSWLTYLNFFSYVKLAITLIKYIPQAYMNFRRKSTTGWSIGNVLLDFTGGTFSILQMFLIAYNNNEWNSIFGDFAKFGLGLFAALFDIFFIIQHYVLYRQREYKPVKGDNYPAIEGREDAPLIT